MLLQSMLVLHAVRQVPAASPLLQLVLQLGQLGSFGGSRSAAAVAGREAAVDQLQGRQPSSHLVLSMELQPLFPLISPSLCFPAHASHSACPSTPFCQPHRHHGRCNSRRCTCRRRPPGLGVWPSGVRRAAGKLGLHGPAAFWGAAADSAAISAAAPPAAPAGRTEEDKLQRLRAKNRASQARYRQMQKVRRERSLDSRLLYHTASLSCPDVPSSPYTHSHNFPGRSASSS